LQLARGNESALQFNVPELVDRACLSQDSSLMDVGEKAHQQPRQPVVQRQPPSGERGSLAATHPACDMPPLLLPERQAAGASWRTAERTGGYRR
jgi:hypothetical protein